MKTIFALAGPLLQAGKAFLETVAIATGLDYLVFPRLVHLLDSASLETRVRSGLGRKRHPLYTSWKAPLVDF